MLCKMTKLYLKGKEEALEGLKQESNLSRFVFHKDLFGCLTESGQDDETESKKVKSSIII